MSSIPYGFCYNCDRNVDLIVAETHTICSECHSDFVEIRERPPSSIPRQRLSSLDLIQQGAVPNMISSFMQSMGGSILQQMFQGGGNNNDDDSISDNDDSISDNDDNDDRRDDDGDRDNDSDTASDDDNDEDSEDESSSAHLIPIRMEGVFDSLLSAMGIEQQEDEDDWIRRMMQVIEDREARGTSPADPEAIARLQQFTITKEFLITLKREHSNSVHVDGDGDGDCDCDSTPSTKIDRNDEHRDNTVNDDDDDTKHDCDHDHDHVNDDGDGIGSGDESISEDLPECTICVDSMQVGDNVVRMPCSHLFHKGCLMEWFKGHNTCPLCRHQLPRATVEEGGDGISNGPQNYTYISLPNNVHIHSFTPLTGDGNGAAHMQSIGAVIQSIIAHHHQHHPPQAQQQRQRQQEQAPTSTTSSLQRQPSSSSSSRRRIRRTTATGEEVTVEMTDSGTMLVHRDDGSVVIMDHTGLRIRHPDGTIEIVSGRERSQDILSSSLPAETPSSSSSSSSSSSPQQPSSATRPSQGESDQAGTVADMNDVGANDPKGQTSTSTTTQNQQSAGISSKPYARDPVAVSINRSRNNPFARKRTTFNQRQTPAASATSTSTSTSTSATTTTTTTTSSSPSSSSPMHSPSPTMTDSE